MLRIKGELLLLQGAPGAVTAAEGYFRQRPEGFIPAEPIRRGVGQ
jgi:hypothetical protein